MSKAKVEEHDFDEAPVLVFFIVRNELDFDILKIS